jgi:hypothetical protein
MFRSTAMMLGKRKRSNMYKKPYEKKDFFAWKTYGDVSVYSTADTHGVASAALRYGQNETNAGDSNGRARILRHRLANNQLKKIAKKILHQKGFSFTKLVWRKTLLKNRWGNGYYGFDWLEMKGSERNIEVVVDFTLLNSNMARMRKFRLDKEVGLNRYVVQLSCGCCDAEVYFDSDEAIQRAFDEAGLVSSGTIRDSLGNTVDGVDTFYGYRCIGEKRRSLDYLANKIGITF